MAGKAVLITGGARGGLGRAVASLLAAEGAAVVVTSRKAPARARASRKTGQSLFGKVTPLRLDVADEKSVRRVFGWLDSAFGRLDVLVNNAGIGVFKPMQDISALEWREVIDTNLTGTFLCSKEAFKRMKRQGGGRIINVGSVADHVALPGNSAYGASKFGVRGLSQIMIEEGKAHGIRVSLLSLGATYTAIWQGRKGFSAADMLSPSDVAETVLDIARRPLRVRVDEVRLMPPKGVL